MAVLDRELRKRIQSYDLLKKAAADARRPYDKDVWLNVAFYLDEQYVEWKDDIASIRKIPRRDDQTNAPRPVVNKIMHFVNQEHAFALKSKPTIDVLPATDDPLDISEANVSLAYLNWVFDPTQANFPRILSHATLWALIAGESYLKWIFNPRLKRPDILQVSPLDLYSDPYVSDFSKSRYVIHTQFMDVEHVHDLYDKEVKPSSVDPNDMRVGLLREMGQSPVLEGATVNELWMKPTRRNPDGLYVVWAGDTVLVEPDKFPYEHGRLPFTQIGYIPRPGSQHFSSTVKYLRSAQMELNKYHAQRINIREAFANPKWWIPSELELEVMPNDSPRQVLRGNSNAGTIKPELIQPTGMADNNEGEWITDEMMHIVGIHEVSQGQVPGRVESARAIEALREADESRVSELVDTVRNSISEGGWQLLMLAKQFVPAEQVVQTYSREGLPEVQRFKSENVKEGMRVKVQMGTGLSRSRAGRQQEVLEFWREGVIRDPEAVADLLEIPTPAIVSNKVYDVRLARNENLTLAGGQAIEPNSWDDHAIHLREHNNFRKGHDYLTLSADKKSKFEHHCQRHDDLQDQMLEKELVKQQKMMMLQQGAVPADGSAQSAAAPPSPASPAEGEIAQ